MDRDEQIQAFEDQLDALCDRFSDEFDLDYATVIGALHLKAYTLCKQADTPQDDDK